MEATVVSFKSKRAFVAQNRLVNYQASLRLEGLAGSVPVVSTPAEIEAKKKELLSKYRRDA